MDEEIQAVEPQEPTSTPETVESHEDATADASSDEPKQEDERKFTQAELNEIIQKEKAKAEAKAERRALKVYKETMERLAPPVQQVEQVSEKPTREQFYTEADFIEALTDWKIDQREAPKRQQSEAERREASFKRAEDIYAKASKDPNFDRDEFDALPITPVIAQTVMESESPEKLMIYFHANPEDVERIAKLSPARQAAEIGKLEDKLTTAPKVSKAPAPITPIGKGNQKGSNFETMSQADYEAERKKRGAAWAR